MEQLTVLSDNTPLGNQALQLHFEIKSSLALAASAITEFARQLKQMRDQKLYEHLGFEKFEDYVEQAHGIKQRQAYTYIQTYEKLSPKLMEDNAQLGITKLSLLCQISAPEREDFAQENNLAGLTVDEIKNLIEEKNGLHQQISLLQTENLNSEALLKQYDKENENLKKELAEKTETIDNLFVEQQPIDVTAVEIEKIEAAVQQALKNADKEKQAAVKEAIQKEKDKASKMLMEKVAAEKQDTIKETENRLKQEFAQQTATLSQEMAAAKQTAEKLEKQLELAGNQNTVKFSILFEQVQKDILSCQELLQTIKAENPQQAEKLANVLKQVVGQMVE